MRIHRSVLGFLIVLVSATSCGKDGKKQVGDRMQAPIASEQVSDTFGDLKIAGADELAAAKTGQISLHIQDVKEGSPAPVCELDGEVIDCSSGSLTLDLSTLKQGSHRLVINRDSDNPAILNFCAQTCDEAIETEPLDPGLTQPSEPRFYDPLSRRLQVGYAFQVTIPEGMHVTEYSTSKTMNLLSFYRIMSHSDPYYLGTTRCNRDFDSMVQSISPSGTTFDYCHSTPTREEYKDEFEGRLANNHIELATDPFEVEAGHHERLSVSVYDFDYEYMAGRSRFLNLCGHSPINSTVLPMLDDFFRGRNPEGVRFWYCDTILPGPNGAPEMWKVGGFIEAEAFDWNCRDCRYSRALEVLYMAKPDGETWRDDYFARSAQDFMLDTLTKLQP